jgi:hypothetical protein
VSLSPEFRERFRISPSQILSGPEAGATLASEVGQVSGHVQGLISTDAGWNPNPQNLRICVASVVRRYDGLGASFSGMRESLRRRLTAPTRIGCACTFWELKGAGDIDLAFWLPASTPLAFHI